MPLSIRANLMAQEKRQELAAYAAERRAQSESAPPVDPESLVEGEDALSRQLLALVAENAAIEDALYYLDQVGCARTLLL